MKVRTNASTLVRSGKYANVSSKSVIRSNRTFRIVTLDRPRLVKAGEVVEAKPVKQLKTVEVLREEWLDPNRCEKHSIAWCATCARQAARKVFLA